MNVVQSPLISDIEFFGYICADLGYMNNVDLEAMKYDWCRKVGGEWWGAYHNNEIVSVAGCHPFHDGWRVLFRGAQIMPAQNGLSKTHMTSIPWRHILPKQLEYIKGAPAYITTNVEHDASGLMNRTHRVMKMLSKQNIVEWFAEEEMYGALQTVWKLNVKEYTKTLV